MYAVIESGGKQYRVAPGDVIDVELLGEPGDSTSFRFDRVLMVSGDNGPQIGKALEGAADEAGRGESSSEEDRFLSSIRSFARGADDFSRMVDNYRPEIEQLEKTGAGKTDATIAIDMRRSMLEARRTAAQGNEK